MTCSKFQLSARMKRNNLRLNEKITVLGHTKQHPSQGCRKMAERFNAGKTATENISKQKKKLKVESEFYTGDRKKRKHGHYHTINENLLAWCKNCARQTSFVMAQCFKKKQRS